MLGNSTDEFRYDKYLKILLASLASALRFVFVFI
jgi:hypothetical protein